MQPRRCWADCWAVRRIAKPRHCAGRVLLCPCFFSLGSSPIAYCTSLWRNHGYRRRSVACAGRDFFSVARANANKLHTLNAVDGYDTTTLAAIHQRITAALGASGFAQPCEIEGVIECAAPLVGPVSGQPLVAYTYTVNREYEERVTTTNDKPETRVERRSEQIEQNERRVPFMVRDERGHVQVLPDGATLELIDTGNRFVEMP